MGFPHTNFGSLVQALYGIEEGIAGGLWEDSSPPDLKGKKPGSSPRSSNASAIGTSSHKFSRWPQTHRQSANIPYQMIQ